MIGTNARRTFLEPLVRFLFRAYFVLVHRVRVVGLEHIPPDKDNLVIVSNHASFLDGPLLWAFLPLRFKTVVSKEIAERPLLRPFLSGEYAVRVKTLNPYSLKQVVRLAAAGVPLLIFPEGRRSTTGGIMKIYEGAGFVAAHAEASLLPVYLNTYSAPTSLAPVRKRFFARLTIVIGKLRTPPPYPRGKPRRQRKEAADRIYDMLTQTRFEGTVTGGTLPAEFIRLCKRNGGRTAYKDATGAVTSYRKALLGAFLLGRRFAGSPGRNIGILLPNLGVTVVLFFGLLLSRKVPAFLNYAAGAVALEHMLALADVETVVTSREFLSRIGLPAALFGRRRLVFLEDERKGMTGFETLRAFWKASFPGRQYRMLPDENRETAVILFTSGSEGVPKGVALSHENIVTNIYQCLARLDVTERDYLLNPLPLFHSFGLTVGALMALFAGAPTFLYLNPLHYRVVPETAYRENCTVLLGTNVFLNGYGRKANPYDLYAVRYVYCGAEALSDEVFMTYAKTFGKRVLSGYGATECSPVISLNNGLEHEYGSVGRVLPGMEYRIEPVPGIDPKGGRAGLLFVRGKNVMQGYLKNDAANRKLWVRDRGWYDTGDIVELSGEGFLRITGRLRRFAKVSGEMISLTAIEEALTRASAGRRETAVTAVPDPERGETILAVSNDTAMTLKAVRDRLRGEGFSELALPRGIRYMKTIPKLATGKVDYVALNGMLQEKRAKTARV